MENTDVALVIQVSDDGKVYISHSEIQIIADAAADQAVEKIRRVIYEEVGKSVVKWLAYLLGTAIIGAALWLSGKGAFPK